MVPPQLNSRLGFITPGLILIDHMVTWCVFVRGGAGGGPAGPPSRGRSAKRIRGPGVRVRGMRVRPLELGAHQRGNDHGGRAGGVGATDSTGWVRC